MPDPNPYASLLRDAPDMAGASGGPRRPPAITLFGSALPVEGQPEWELAERTGYDLAQAGFAIVNGGYGGTMEAAARGARKAGGKVTGVAVSVFNRTPNPWNSEVITAATLFERLEILLRLGDGFLLFPGGTGTLTEFALAWEYTLKGFSRQRPIALLGEFWRPVVDCLLRAPGRGQPALPAASAECGGGAAPVPPPEWPEFLHMVETPLLAAALFARLLKNQH